MQCLADGPHAGIYCDFSPKVVLIKKHFNEQYKFEQWKLDRVCRLAKCLGCTVRELLALCGVFHQTQVKHLCNRKEKAWPPEIVIHLAKIERFANERIFSVGTRPDAQDVAMAAMITNVPQPQPEEAQVA